MHVITTRWSRNRWVAAGTTVLLGTLGWSNVRADAVTDWHEIAATTLCKSTPPLRPGPHGFLDLAVVQAAVYDAVQAIGGKYKPYHVQIPGASGSPEVAAATAAHDVLVKLYPTQAEKLGATYKEYLTKKGLKEDDPGVAVGQKAAAGIVAFRADDGRNPNPPPPFVGEKAIGVWRTTPPQSGYFAQMASPWLGEAKPFAVQSNTQFRAKQPPALTSEEYTKDYNEVKAVGAKTGSTRTPEQTEIADFFDSNHLCLTFQRAPHNVVANAVSANAKSIDDSARVMMLITMSFSDAAITCWNDKRHFAFWRPVTAINEGEDDGNGHPEGGIGVRRVERTEMEIEQSMNLELLHRAMHVVPTPLSGEAISPFGGIIREDPDGAPCIVDAGGEPHDQATDQAERRPTQPAVEPIAKESPNQKARDHIHQHTIRNRGLAVRHRGRFAGLLDGPACLFELRLDLVDPPAVGFGIGGRMSRGWVRWCQGSDFLYLSGSYTLAQRLKTEKVASPSRFT